MDAPWVIEAKKLIAEGKTLQEVAKTVGKSVPTVSQRCGPNAGLYLFRDLGHATLAAYGFGKKPQLDGVRDVLEQFPEILEGLMSERTYRDVKLIHAGVARKGLQIVCSKQLAPNCMKTEDFINKTNSSTSPDHASRVFRNHGWVVGGGPRADICPNCYSFMREQRRSKKEEPAVAATIISTVNEPRREEPKVPAASPHIPVKHVTLADVDKTSKRLIDAKLDEVYDAKRGGYLDGYNDAKLADELGTMVEWVALVRDFGHGPEKSAVDNSRRIEELTKLGEELKERGHRLEIAMNRLTELDTQLNDRLTEYQKSKRDFDLLFNEFKRSIA